jgi:hypothetical protein
VFNLQNDNLTGRYYLAADTAHIQEKDALGSSAKQKKECRYDCGGNEAEAQTTTFERNRRASARAYPTLRAPVSADAEDLDSRTDAGAFTGEYLSREQY